MKIFFDYYSIPTFSKINPNTNNVVQTVRVMDVAGASICAGSNLFAEIEPNLSVTEIKKLYDPRHSNLSTDLLRRVGVDSRINNIWLNVAIQHPICFWNSKFYLAKYLIGANSGKQFLITHPSIDENEYGYTMPKSSLRNMVVAYIIKASDIPFFRPWFIYLISIITFIYMIRFKALTIAHLIIFLSAFFYFIGLVIMGNAADARLLFYTNTILLIFIFISILEFIKRYIHTPK